MRAVAVDPAIERACLDLYALAESLTHVCGRRRRLGCTLYETTQTLVDKFAEALRRSGGRLEALRETSAPR